MYKDEVEQVKRTGDTLLVLEGPNPPKRGDFDHETIVILIHGFTSHGFYMKSLGSHLHNWGCQVFLFNYNSFEGIQRAAESLKTLLLNYDALSNGKISERGVILVAHSMGGLVARKFILDNPIPSLIRGLIMLGTPNDGVFKHKRLVEAMIEYGEYLSGVMPNATLPQGDSVKELTKTDNKSGKPFIDVLNEAWESSLNGCIPTLTISGGRKFLTFSDNSLRNSIINLMIVQKLIGKEDNDGLITERSVNMSRFHSTTCSHPYNHYNSYPDYSTINHTYLIQNQTLATKIITWIQSL